MIGSIAAVIMCGAKSVRTDRFGIHTLTAACGLSETVGPVITGIHGLILAVAANVVADQMKFMIPNLTVVASADRTAHRAIATIMKPIAAWARVLRVRIVDRASTTTNVATSAFQIPIRHQNHLSQ